ncbi:hypothetical protein ISCGN_022742 [Ixodes scapularis]
MARTVPPGLVCSCAVRCFPGPPVPTPPPPPMLFPLMAAAASQPRQMVYVFPPLGQLEPSCVRLVTDSADASTAVACLLGFFRAVCRDGYRLVLEASEREGVWLVEVPVGPEYLRRKLRSLRPSGGEPDSSPTMDDFYLLLGVMLCNLPRVRGSNLSRLDESGLIINKAQCEIGVIEINFLGHHLDQHGLQPLNEQVKAVRDFPRPTSDRKVLRESAFIHASSKFIYFLAMCFLQDLVPWLSS